MVWNIWVVWDVAKGAICEFGNASSHEVVEVERDRAIRNGFVSEEIILNCIVVLILENTHT